MAYKARPGETQHHARERIAREKGFDSYRQYRQQSGQARERATRELAARDPGYARTLRSSTAAIRARARERVATPAGTILTTTSMARLRAAVRDHPDVVLPFTIVVTVEGVDRRRRDARRSKGRDTGYRTLRIGITDDAGFIPRDAQYLVSTDTVADFEADLDVAITDAIQHLDSPTGNEVFTIDTISVVLPRSSSSSRAAA